jgi:golgi phosphoprotein 3
MDFSITEQFVILALHPEKGRIAISLIPFRYSMTGGLLMDYLEKGEITMENKRVIPSIKKNGETVHDLFADRIMESSKNRRISFWLRRMSLQRRLIFSELIKSLEKKNIIRTEQKRFLNIIPYKRYWFSDNSIRYNLIESLRGILLYNRKPGKKEVMLLGLVEASKSYSVLAQEKGEARILRKKNEELLKGDIIGTEISQTIKEVQAAIIASVMAATTAAHASH